MLDPELGLGDLVLIELAKRNRLSVQGGGNVLQPMQGDQRRIDSVTRPAKGRSAQRLADIRPRFAGADGGDHLLADGVLLGGVGVASWLEGMVGAIPGALDDRLPCRRVRFLEARKHPNERGVGRGLDPVIERRQQHLAPAALKDLGVRHDVPDQAIAIAHRARAAAVHALAGFLAFRGRRIALGVERLLGGVGLDDQPPNVLGRLARNEHEQDRAVSAGRPRGLQHIFLGAGPAIANPDRDAAAVDHRRSLFPMDQKLAWFFRRALHDADGAHRLVDLAVQQLVALELDRRIVVVELGLPVAELAIPVAAFAGLKTILVADQHQHALVAQLFELVFDLRPQFAVVGRQIVDQQVGEVILGGANADIGAGFALQLADQKDQAANALRDRPFGSADQDDALVDFAEQHTRIHHLWGERFEKFIGRHYRTQRTFGDLRDRIMDDAQLRAELAARAGRIDLAEAVLPKPPPNRQQRIIIDDDRAILDRLADARALKLPRDFAGVLVEQGAHIRDCGGLFLQQHLASDRLDLGVGQRERGS